MKFWKNLGRIFGGRGAKKAEAQSQPNLDDGFKNGKPQVSTSGGIEVASASDNGAGQDFEGLIEQARASAKAKDWVGAEAAYQQALAYETREEAYAGLGRVLIQRNDSAGAIAVIKQGFLANPGSASLFAVKGDLHLRLGQIDEAKAAFSESLAIDAKHCAAFDGIARIAAHVKDWSAAVAGWDSCLAVAPKDPAAFKWQSARAEALLKLARYDEAERAFSGLLKKRAGRPEGHVGLARTAMLRGDWETAVVRWRTCVERFAQHKQVSGWRLSLAESLLQTDGIQEAEHIFEALKDGNPELIAAHEGLAKSAEKQDQPDKAIALYRACIAAFPEGRQVLRWRIAIGGLLLKAGQIDAADSEYQALAEQYPNNAAVKRGLGQVARSRKRTV